MVSVLDFTLRAEGFRTYTAHDGIEAMEQIRRHHPAMMLLDVMMPRMDGWSVLEALRAMPAAERPGSSWSPRWRAADRSRATAMGAEGYVPKPFDIESLLDVLHGLELAS